MPVLISPSVLAADLACLADEIARAVEGGCDRFHVDIMDHHFVPNLSFGPSMVETVRRLTDRPIDVHLMVDNPGDMIDSFAGAGADSITVHVEVAPVDPVLDRIADKHIARGLSFRPDTPPGALAPFLNRIDIALVMSVYPGFGGQRFMEESYARIRELADMVSHLPRSPIISVDGGVDLSNAPLLAAAGVTCLVAGSSIFRNHGAASNVVNMREALASAGF